MATNLTNWNVTCWSSWDLCTDVKSSVKYSDQVCSRVWDHVMRPLRSSVEDINHVDVIWQQWLLEAHNYKAFHLLYLSLLQSHEDSQYHIMQCTMYRILSAYIHSINRVEDSTEVESEEYIVILVNRIEEFTFRLQWSMFGDVLKWRQWFSELKELIGCQDQV